MQQKSGLWDSLDRHLADLFDQPVGGQDPLNALPAEVLDAKSERLPECPVGGHYRPVRREHH
jgi:hypothetical protein